MGNNCAFALVAGGGFRGPPPRLPVVIIESLLSPLPASRPVLLGCLTSRGTLSSSRSRVLLFGALSLRSASSVYRTSPASSSGGAASPFAAHRRGIGSSSDAKITGIKAVASAIRADESP